MTHYYHIPTHPVNCYTLGKCTKTLLPLPKLTTCIPFRKQVQYIHTRIRPICQQLLRRLVGRAMHQNCKELGSIPIGGPNSHEIFLTTVYTYITLEHHLPTHPVICYTLTKCTKKLLYLPYTLMVIFMPRIQK